MKKLAIFSLMLSLIFVLVQACGGESGSDGNDKPSTSTTAAATTPDIDAKKIWKIRCIACHGLYGNQGLNGAANLQEVTTSLEERVNIITNGRQGENGVMQAFGDILSAEEIEAVAKHTMTFNKDL